MTVDEFKTRAMFFKEGHIIPQWIIKGRSKIKHNVKFGCDMYVLRTPLGPVCMADLPSVDYGISYLTPGATCYIRISRCKCNLVAANAAFIGSNQEALDFHADRFAGNKKTVQNADDVL